MAEIEFLLNENEQLKLLKYLESIEALFVPCIGYSKPKCQYLCDANEAVSMWRSANLTAGVGPIFLLWGGISTYELQYDKITKNNEKILYYPAQGDGGPYIDYEPCNAVIDNKGTIIVSGSVGYRMKYWIEELDDNIAVSEEIKEKYKEISKFIRSICQRLSVKNFKRYYWVGNETLKLLKQGSIHNSLNLELP